MSLKTPTTSNDGYPSVATFFAKSKQQPDFSDKNQFTQKKFNEAIEKIHIEPNRNGHIESIDHDDEIRILSGKIRSLEKDLKHAKILLRKASDLNLQKDLEIKCLKEKLKKNCLNEKKSEILFGKFEYRFEKEELKKIRSIRAGQRNDSTFVLSILKCLYKNEEAKLSERRVTDRKYGGTKKNELSAEKKEIMREMLEERVLDELDEQRDQDEVTNRLKQLNKHMRNALSNSLIAHKKKSGEVNSTTATKPSEPNQFQSSHEFMQSHLIEAPKEHYQHNCYSNMTPNYQSMPFPHHEYSTHSQNHQPMTFSQHTHTSGYAMPSQSYQPMAFSQHTHPNGFSTTPQNSPTPFF